MLFAVVGKNKERRKKVAGKECTVFARVGIDFTKKIDGK